LEQAVLRRGSGEDYIMRSFMSCTPHHFYSADEIDKNEMGGECGMCGKLKRCVQGFGGEN
jgi:hypothetical protein